MDIHALAEQLQAHPDYRLIRRYQRPSHYASPNPTPKLVGLIVDVETTGLDPDNDAILEIALLPFEYTEDGTVYRLLDGYNGFEDPKRTIPAHITQLTGITNAMVLNTQLGEARITELVDRSQCIVAHNAQFDRRFLERRFPIFSQKPWTCSAHQIPWHTLGIESFKLSYIAYRYGFFYEGHRALNDCEACLHILAQPLPTLFQTGLHRLLESLTQASIRLFAVNAPFANKDLLRGRGYSWNDGNNGRPRAWYKDLLAEEKHQELTYLGQEIFGRPVDCPTVTIDAWNRFSDRI